MTDGILFTEVKNSIDTLGIDKVVAVLRKARIESFKNEDYLFVVNAVTESIGVGIEEMKKNNSRSDKRKAALGFCVYWLNREFGYSFSDIATALPLGLDRNSMYQYGNIISEAKLVNPHSNIDKLIASNYEQLKNLITNYKSKKNGNIKEQTR